MTTIWKFPIKITDLQLVPMSKSAQIISAQIQGDVLCLWAIVDTNEVKDQRVIEIYGTGHPMRDQTQRRHIVTVQDGQLVWHVFEAQ